MEKRNIKSNERQSWKQEREHENENVKKQLEENSRKKEIQN